MILTFYWLDFTYLRYDYFLLNACLIYSCMRKNQCWSYHWLSEYLLSLLLRFLILIVLFIFTLFFHSYSSPLVFRFDREFEVSTWFHMYYEIPIWRQELVQHFIHLIYPTLHLMLNKLCKILMWVNFILHELVHINGYLPFWWLVSFNQ